MTVQQLLDFLNNLPEHYRSMKVFYEDYYGQKRIINTYLTSNGNWANDLTLILSSEEIKH